MKRAIIAMFLLLLAGSVQQADAQQRRRTTTRKTTGTTRKTTTTARKTTMTQQRTTIPEKQGPKEVAFYEVKVKDFCVDSAYVYYVEPLPNNAVMKIDRKTGEISTLLPGIANVYEGRRDIIQRINIANGKFIMRHNKDDYSIGTVGVLLEDGKYQDYKSWEDVIMTNGHYALIKRRDSGTELYDVENMKLVPMKFLPGASSVPSVDGVLLYEKYLPVLDSNGCVWYTYKEKKKFGVYRLSSTDNTKFFELSNQTYVVSEVTVDGYNDPINWLAGAGQYLYASCKRRIYRLNMLNPTGWEEYAKIPSTLDSGFYLFWPNQKGDILNNGKRCWFYRVGAFDTPQSLGEWEPITTGMTTFGWEKIYPNLQKIQVDLDNNYIMSGGSSITIYNPDGVVGFDKARGKIVKP